MRIGNPSSLFVQNALTRTTTAIARSLERLSSGLRVNSPADDPAAYSESVTLSAQIRGYTQAIQNVNQATGLIEAASSALQTQIDIVQKIREIAVQASNGSLTTTDRANLNTQVQQLLSEFSRITSTTQFNGTNLLDGSFGTKTIQLGANSTDNTSFQIPSLQASATFQKTIGTGTFQPVVSESSGNIRPTRSALADLNGDGKLDLVTASSNGTLQVWMGLGNGNFVSPVSYNIGNASQTANVVVGDVNGDGVADIVTADQVDNTLSILIGNGDGTFKARTTVATGTSPTYVELKDLNHDGKLDLVETDMGNDTLSVFLGNGDGSFAARKTYALEASSYIYGFDAGDINGDGNQDIVVGNQGSGNFDVLLGNGDGTFKAETTFSGASFDTNLLLADMNNDGKLDLIYESNNSHVAVRLGNGDGTFQAANSVTTDLPNSESIAVGDLNGDGVLDLIVGTGNTSVDTYLGNGDGTFRTGQSFGGGADTGVVVGDLNNDGVLDIIAPYGVNKSILIAMGNSQNVTAVSNVNVSTQGSAQALLSVLDNALTNLKSEQSQLGALHNRLDITASQNSLLVQDYTDARDQATGVDIALETSNLVRNQILQQSQVAMLAQGNVDAEVVLQLLQGL